MNTRYEFYIDREGDSYQLVIQPMINGFRGWVVEIPKISADDTDYDTVVRTLIAQIDVYVEKKLCKKKLKERVPVTG